MKKNIIVDFIDYDHNKPIILNCKIDSDYCFPLVSPGSALNDMMTFYNYNYNIIDKSSTPS